MAKPLKPHWIGPQYSEISRDWEMRFLARKKLPLVIGLTGPTRVGKTMVAKRLATEYGFHYESTSAILREMSKMMGEEGGGWRELGEFGRMLRKEMGADVMARRVLDRIYGLKDVEFIVVDGILHPAEARTLADKTKFVLIGLVASTGTRVNEAFRWYEGRKDDIRQDLMRRDAFENYDYKAFVASRQSSENPARPNEGDVYTPDVMGCLALVDQEYLIDLGEQPFNVRTVFDPTDQIVRSLLKRASDEYS